MMDIDTLLESPGVFKTIFPSGQEYGWRLLTLKEYNIFNSLRSATNLTEIGLNIRVFKRCYLGDSNLLSNLVPAGYYASIGQLIMWASGDCNIHTLKEDIVLVQNAYNGADVLEHMKRVIFTAFPTYTTETADTWTRPQLLQKFVVSEYVLVNRNIGYKPLDIEAIGKPEAKTPKPQHKPVNMKGDSDYLNDRLGFWDKQDALDLAANPASAGGLSPEQARKLDKLRR